VSRSDIVTDSEDARQRARHWRHLVRGLADEQMREKLLDLAKQYDQMAEAMEREESGEPDDKRPFG
jgi:hypothetical protein